MELPSTGTALTTIKAAQRHALQSGQPSSPLKPTTARQMAVFFGYSFWYN